MSLNQTKKIIGSQEWCSFPDLGVPAIKARVDSGAQTSSIHAYNIHNFRRHGEPWVSFEVLPLQKNRHTLIRCESPLFARRLVKSSSGISESRCVILTSIKIDKEVWKL
jgi:ribosomal protein S6--L-glutamate ligase